MCDCLVCSVFIGDAINLLMYDKNYLIVGCKKVARNAGNALDRTIGPLYSQAVMSRIYEWNHESGLEWNGI